MKSNFEAKYMKKSIKLLDKHLQDAQKYSTTKSDNKKGTSKEYSIWKKIFILIRSYF
jgi:hypothetical protein